ncbi:MAG: hypothetical protein HYV27_10570 [Candidatus Hydrogenedentes bacterium]|nr:hypothetical protein [Candidatus Hydrogenedentota bacterium]
MPSIAVPVGIMAACGFSTGWVAHRRIPGFLWASVLGGGAGALLWVAGALILVLPTEGLDWRGLESLASLLESLLMTSTITVPAALAAGLLARGFHARTAPSGNASASISRPLNPQG